MVSALEVGSGGLGSSEGLAGLLSTLLRIVGRPDKIPREVPSGIYVGLVFLPGDGEKVLVSSCFENDCDFPFVGVQQFKLLSNFTLHTYCKLISF